MMKLKINHFIHGQAKMSKMRVGKNKKNMVEDEGNAMNAEGHLELKK